MTRALGIDLGTSGVRAAIVDGTEIVATRRAPVAPEARRDPAALLAAVETVLDALDLSAVGALAVDGTSGSVLPVDRRGDPVGDILLYGDAVPPPDAAPQGATALGRAIRAAGAPCVARVLHEADWVAGQFSGLFDVTDENNALKTGYDPLARRWAEALGACGMPPALLPRVVPPGTPIGPVREAARARFGFPADARVVAGTTDGCASFLAAGADGTGEAVTALGSTLTVKLFSDRPVVSPAFGVYSHRWRDGWLVGGSSNTGGAALARHFTPERIEALCASIDPSVESGLDYYPLPAPGERFPVHDPALPPRLLPRPADEARFLHGLLEGVARVEVLGYRRLEALGAPKLVRVFTVGGGAANRTWSAIRARVLGVPLAPARSEEAAVGAALLAYAAGAMSSIGG